MPASTDLVRWAIPAILLTAIVGVAVQLWWEKHRPTVPAHVAELRAWRRMPTEEQAAVDAEALAIGAAADMGAREAEAGAAEAARLAVERAAAINAQYYP
jgi:hypothetical protein